MNNVISLATRKPITTALAKARAGRKAAPAPESFCRTDDLEPHLFEPGRERDGAVHVALTLAMFHASPTSHMPRNPHAALIKTRRALALLELECAGLDRTKRSGGAA